MTPLLTLSIVSHGQAPLIRLLLDDFEHSEFQDFEVLLTINLPEDEAAFGQHTFPLRILRNLSPKGFGANHNAAFAHAQGRFFAIVNPDIRLDSFDAVTMTAPFVDPSTGAVAPLILSRERTIEDSVRRFPTFFRLARRVLLRRWHPDYRWDDLPIDVDWTAGMFVVFRPEAFKGVGGFDDRRFFMYFEDVDICERLWKNGWSVKLQPLTSVIHDAQRQSHRSWKHMRWHLTSAARYLSGL